MVPSKQCILPRIHYMTKPRLPLGWDTLIRGYRNQKADHRNRTSLVSHHGVKLVTQACSLGLVLDLIGDYSRSKLSPHRSPVPYFWIAIKLLVGFLFIIVQTLPFNIGIFLTAGLRCRSTRVHSATPFEPDPTSPIPIRS